MAEAPKIVSFPKTPKARQDKTDESHVRNVQKAWRALQRAIADARNFGLTVEAEIGANSQAPRITRIYR